MNKPYSFLAACVLVLFLYSCSKKTTPSESAPTTTMGTNPSAPKKVDSTAVVVKKPVKAKPLPTVPKVIVVSDAAAKTAVDGRKYYDMQGRRYWRSNKDGKFYLYNKSMQNDPNFKAPAKS